MSLENYRINSLDEYRESQQYAIKNPEEFWKDIANTFEWKTPFDNVLNYNWNDVPNS